MKLRRYAEKQAQQLCESLARAVAEGDVDAVHQVRVGCRRLEEPLQLCRPWVSDEKIDKAIQQLTRLRRKFRKIRDLDVLLASLTGDNTTGLVSSDIDRLRAEFMADRDRRWHQVQSEIDTAAKSRSIQRRVARILCKLEAAFSHSNPRSKLTSPTNAPSNKSDEEFIDRLGQQIAAASQKIVHQMVDRSSSNHDLHLVRIQLKQLRYAIELDNALTDQEHDELIQALKSAQDMLGRWNDQLQAVRLLLPWAIKRHYLTKEPEFVGRLLVHAAWRLRFAREQAAQFDTHWPNLSQAILARCRRREEIRL